MTRYLLDTNIVSHLIKQHPAVVGQVVRTPMASLFMSVITEGELLFGLANRPRAKHLHLAVRELLRRIEVLSWDRSAAEHYGTIRANLQRSGRGLGSLDLLIAAHASSLGGILVTNDKAFRQVADLSIEDWTSPYMPIPRNC